MVISIIGLLSTLAVVALNNARQKSRDTKRVADIRQVQTAIELYFNDNSQYPTGFSGLGGTVSLGATCLDSNGFNSGGAPCTGEIYMGLLPKEPLSDNNVITLFDTCIPGIQEFVGCEYFYVQRSNTSYDLYFYLEDAVNQLGSGSHTASERGIE